MRPVLQLGATHYAADLGAGLYVCMSSGVVRGAGWIAATEMEAFAPVPYAGFRVRYVWRRGRVVIDVANVAVVDRPLCAMARRAARAGLLLAPRAFEIAAVAAAAGLPRDEQQAVWTDLVARRVVRGGSGP